MYGVPDHLAPSFSQVLVFYLGKCRVVFSITRPMNDAKFANRLIALNTLILDFNFFFSFLTVGFVGQMKQRTVILYCLILNAQELQNYVQLLRRVDIYQTCLKVHVLV